MSFIDALYSGDHAKAKSHIRNLVRIACADGIMDDAEHKLLLKIARKYEVSEESVQEIIEQVDSLPFTPPSSKEERYVQLWNLGRMVMADGIKDPGELSKISQFAIGLGFKAEIVPGLVVEVISIVEAKSYEEDAIEGIDKYIKKH
ncbi:MAG: hypothetical protein OSB25_03630 [Salibacteraceae bacterium]|nr:hypothetical protein [Salibacteraceae bacterium]|tara:strand:+ start:7197 stop:7634 length:438 start_codon:yes stop_codon:yes gene_type:complete